MSEDVILNSKQKEMIALGTSIAAGCQPCTTHHLEAARAASVSDKEMTLALAAGAEARRATTQAMVEWAAKQFGGTVELPEDWVAQQKLIHSLVSVAAAFALNSVAEFRRFAEEAHHFGASDRQIRVAVAMGRTIKGAAAEKIEGAAQQLLADYESEAHLVGGRCGCPA